MKKLLILLLCIFAPMLLIFSFDKIPSLRHSHSKKTEINEYGSFRTESISSFDDRFLLEINDETNMIILTVYNKKDNTIMCSFETVRKWDFWGICFEKDNYNIWIQSGDIGIICYMFDGEKWSLNSNAVRPAYIIPK